jgi:hypothetical protein
LNEPDVVFLDANVLSSAAYGPDAGLRVLWSLPGVRLTTSAYAAEEARRNLSDTKQRERLAGLLEGVRLVEQPPHRQLDADLPARTFP